MELKKVANNIMLVGGAITTIVGAVGSVVELINRLTPSMRKAEVPMLYNKSMGSNFYATIQVPESNTLLWMMVILVIGIVLISYAIIRIRRQNETKRIVPLL